MEPLKFTDRSNSFELDVEIDDSTTPSRGDARVVAATTSSTFSGRGNGWVSQHGMERFCEALIALEHSLRGEAKLQSMSPGAVELLIRSVTSRGHVAVEGKLGKLIYSRDSQFWHSVSFGFEFDQSQLTSAVALPWVRHYAG